ncbi:MAG: hypothetical protein QNJ98_06250 [Planctomycetota bacterium]|nr:hypothetical protein [Planctomycetota bacterium]
MSNGKTPFELEDDDEAARPARQPKPAPVYDDPPEATYVEEPDVDTRTVSERLGKDRPRGDEVIGPPEDWPRESFSYPVRGKGITIMASVVLIMCPLDIMGAFGVARFPAWVLKLVALTFILRGQLRLIGSSAAGHDVPKGWEKALEFNSDAMKRWAAFMGMFMFALVPGWVLIIVDLVEPGLLVLGIGSMYVSVLALGGALEDPRLKLPWNAIPWMLRRPHLCVLGSLGWWALGLTEYALAKSYGSSLGWISIESVVLRVVNAYLVLWSARMLGVMGRSWKQS